MKLAIAGCGRIASVHYEAIEQLIQDKNYNVSISALIDISEINAKHFQQMHQIDSKIFTDFEDALNFLFFFGSFPHIFLFDLNLLKVDILIDWAFLLD